MTRMIRSFEGVVPHLERLYQESESELTKNRLKAFMNPKPVPRGLQNVMEMGINYVRENIVLPVLGPSGERQRLLRITGVPRGMDAVRT